MTTPLQRLLNLAFVVFAPLPVLGVLIFVLNDFAGDDRAAAVLMGIFTFAPMMLLGAINFVLYKNGHSGTQASAVIVKNKFLQR